MRGMTLPLPPIRLDHPEPTPEEWRTFTAFLAAFSPLAGLDVSRYAKPSLWRRLQARQQTEEAGSLQGLLDKARDDATCRTRVRNDILLHVTAMFRDPGYFCEVARHLSMLATFPRPRVWVAACGTGQEVYTYLILLHEAGLAHRCRVYGTDVNRTALQMAERGTIDPALLPEYQRNYALSGGQGDLSRYFEREPQSGQLRLHPTLMERAVFSTHNLLTDGSFNEFHLVSCRNVTMYFDEEGQQQTHRLLHDSLVPLGYLGLGIGESLIHSPWQADYRRLSHGHPLFRRLR